MNQRLSVVIAPSAADLFAMTAFAQDGRMALMVAEAEAEFTEDEGSGSEGGDEAGKVYTGSGGN